MESSVFRLLLFSVILIWSTSARENLCRDLEMHWELHLNRTVQDAIGREHKGSFSSLIEDCKRNCLDMATNAGFVCNAFLFNARLSNCTLIYYKPDHVQHLLPAKDISFYYVQCVNTTTQGPPAMDPSFTSPGPHPVSTSLPLAAGKDQQTTSHTITTVEGVWDVSSTGVVGTGDVKPAHRGGISRETLTYLIVGSSLAAAVIIIVFIVVMVFRYRKKQPPSEEKKVLPASQTSPPMLHHVSHMGQANNIITECHVKLPPKIASDSHKGPRVHSSKQRSVPSSSRANNSVASNGKKVSTAANKEQAPIATISKENVHANSPKKVVTVSSGREQDTVILPMFNNSSSEQPDAGPSPLRAPGQHLSESLTTLPRIVETEPPVRSMSFNLKKTGRLQSLLEVDQQ